MKRSPANILVVSHCDLTGNSAYHAVALARMFESRGFAPALAIPTNLQSMEVVGDQPFVISTYDRVRNGERLFADRKPPALVHAFTPREHVRKFTEDVVSRFDCPYIVHFEDNERVIVEDEIGREGVSALATLPPPCTESMIADWRMHPVRGAAFVAGAGGLSALIDRLLEGQPSHIPSTVFWPGYDPGARDGGRGAPELRRELGIAPSDIVLVYTGNIHPSNLGEVRSLYTAVSLLRRHGLRVRLVRTGWDHVAMEWTQDLDLGDAVIDLGFLSRARLWDVLHLADILVQPGSANEFNDFRFPSKLPDFLVSGKPVVLPRSNIGRELTHGENALLLDRGDAEEIVDCVWMLANDPALRSRIGRAGRNFAERNLRWDKAAESVAALYDEVLERSRADGHRIASASRQSRESTVKLIAFYLPQFHPIPENDEWWGKGFTEWTNVKKGRPTYKDHYQPHVPLEGRYYDLRDPSVLEEQAALARAYGIHGFCFYYYWFDGRRVLERPLDQMLERRSPDMPFCYCWANENWTRRWDGLEHEVLLRQDYTGDWATRFLEDVLPALSDPRYIRVRGRPLLLVYRASLIPDARAATETWRSIARDRLGTDLHLAAVQSFGIGDPRPYGFDSAVEFPPHTARYLLEHSAVEGAMSAFEGYFEDYAQVAQHQLGLELPEYEWFRGVMPSWDNTARRGTKAHILVRSSPERYEEWLRKLVLQTSLRSKVDEPLIFVNAWNEWAEGTHLEPDTRYGYAWLEATERALRTGESKYHELVRRALARTAGRAPVTGAASVPPAPVEASTTVGGDIRRGRRTLTADWFTDADIERIVARYATYSTDDLGYETVEDFVDSFEHLQPLATAQGDLKDVQRPWTVKAILSRVPRPGRILEIGAGQPFVADFLSRCGYDVWVVDPYDGSGNGPVEFEQFRAASPDVTFIRDQFSDALDAIEPQSFDCVYSISVLEHLGIAGLDAVAAGMRKALRPAGLSIHAVDHVLQGNGSAEHLAQLEYLVARHGWTRADLDEALRRASRDIETYFLSAESHNRWRGGVPYREFPMRKCISVHIVSPASTVAGRATER